MTISYPLALPDHVGAVSVRIAQRSTVAVSTSPFTGSQQIQEYAGQWFEMEFNMPPMEKADAALWTAFLLKLNGMAGTFLAGDPAYVKRGDCVAADVSGSHAARAKVLNIKNAGVGETILAGDYLQLGTGANSRLHKNLTDATVDGSGLASLDIWPATRISYSDGATITLLNPKSVWRLTSNEIPYEVGQGLIYGGMGFTAREAI